MLSWEVSSSPCEAEVTCIADGVLTHGRALAAGGNPLPIACLVRDHNGLVAGGAGRTEFKRLFVSSVWVMEKLRGQGIGTEIIRRLETRARETGCTSALIETLNDRVALLYQRVGYTSVATVPNFVGVFTRHIMVKAFEPLRAQSEA
jgi:GNAT superfamily N-acetyltransferase